MFDREVFGIDPDTLELCDPPGDTEVVGTILTHDQVDENIDMLRVFMRPRPFYLWARTERRFGGERI